MAKTVAVWKWRYWYLPRQKWVVTSIYMSEEFALSWIQANSDWPAEQRKIEKIPSTMKFETILEDHERTYPSLIPK